MQIFSVQEEDLAWLDGKPESAMGLQIMQIPTAGRGARMVLVVGGCAVYDPPKTDNRSVDGLLTQRWMQRGGRPLRLDQFEEWLHRLPSFDLPLRNDKIVPVRSAGSPARAFRQAAIGQAAIFGHLPFRGQTGPEDVFYRWEPYPKSRRINQKTGLVSKGTFAAPFS